jgi:Na+/H+-dicarboxylate symporter
MAKPLIDHLRKLPLAAWIIIGLAAGVVAGLALPGAGRAEWSDAAVATAGVIGELWLAALQMTILPLVFALLSTTFIRSTGLAEGTGAARRTVLVIAALYVLGILVGVALTPVLLALWPVSAEMAEALRGTGGVPVDVERLPVADMILGMVPSNIVAAAAGGSLLPMVFFAIVFGAALTRIDEDKRRPIAAVLTGLAEAMFVLVGWVLALAPIGVAGLILVTANTHGTTVLLGLAHYILLYIAIVLVLTLCAYAVAVLFGRVRLRDFARAVLPTQVVAFGTQSSLACLPLILKSATRLGVRENSADISVPLSVSLLRVSSPASSIFYGAYGAIVYGLPYGIALLLAAGVLKTLIEVGSVGIPSQATMVATAAPVLALFGIPLEFLAVILVVETIPDLFKTVCNVTTDVAAATVVDSGRERHPA